mmetsp:Transcript_678/g.1267  ORF Transcript_678/g.1267 Transcript_678/m.1267 type:complete len:182 (+) Transcript_678:368-913(+)
MVKTPVTRSSLMWVGQTTHAITTRMTIWSAGYKIRSISRLDDEEALSRGADILSESFIFAVSGGILVYEYNRSSEKEKKKEEARLQKIRDEASRLQAKLDSLDKRLVALEEYAKANRKMFVLGIGIGANGEYVEPEAVVPIHDDEDNDLRKHVLTEDSNNSDVKKTATKDQRSWRWWWPLK